MIGLIIQARYGSSRLRGKILLPMARFTALIMSRKMRCG